MEFFGFELLSLDKHFFQYLVSVLSIAIKTVQEALATQQVRLWNPDHGSDRTFPGTHRLSRQNMNLV